MVVVNLFTESFNSGTRSIMQNKAVVQKMPLPREIFPIASMLVTLYHTRPAAGDPRSAPAWSPARSSRTRWGCWPR